MHQVWLKIKSRWVAAMSLATASTALVIRELAADSATEQLAEFAANKTPVIGSIADYASSHVAATLFVVVIIGATIGLVVPMLWLLRWTLRHPLRRIVSWLGWKVAAWLFSNRISTYKSGIEAFTAEMSVIDDEPLTEVNRESRIHRAVLRLDQTIGNDGRLFKRLLTLYGDLLSVIADRYEPTTLESVDSARQLADMSTPMTDAETALHAALVDAVDLVDEDSQIVKRILGKYLEIVSTLAAPIYQLNRKVNRS